MGAAQSTTAASFGSCPATGSAQLYTASNSRVYSQLPCATDYPFNDIPSATKTVSALSQCAEHCATVTGCAQAIWLADSKVCWPKSVAKTTGGNTAVTQAQAFNLYATPFASMTTTLAKTTVTPIPPSTTLVTSTRTYPTVTSVAAASTTGAPSFPSYTSVFVDDFSGSYGSLPDTNNWRFDTGLNYPGGPAQWGTGEIETYTSSTNNVLQSGSGSLLIIPQNNSGSWTSARIETSRADFMAPAGKKMKIQAQIRLPGVTSSNGIGIWPAFWTLGGNLRNNYQSWPTWGEFDILENVDGTGNVYAGMHCGFNPGGPCNEPNGLGNRATCSGPNGCQGQWHTFTLDVDRSNSNAESVTWSMDGTTTNYVTQSQVNNNTAWNAIIHQGHFLLLNVAVGGSFPNALAPGGYSPQASTVGGMDMRIDYVGVWYSQ